MATITPTKASEGNHVLVWTWTPMRYSGSDVGAPIKVHDYADRSVQVTGTFGTGGNVRIEGSNDGTNYVVLADPSSANLDIATEKIEAVLEFVRYIRPRITAGDGTTSLTVTMVCRRNRDSKG